MSSIAPLADGTILLSGELQVEGEFFTRAAIRVDQTGMYIPSPGVVYGGGKLKPWEDKFYAASSQTVRRLNPNATVDPTFIHMNNGPYFLSLQGGDYHVYPDGRILMSGAHELDDPVRGFVGLYNLIWFTNTGHLDTTRTHRKGDGVIYEIEETPDGGFLCSGPTSVYEGTPVPPLFKVQADGALDPLFDSPVAWGEAFSFLPLADGRFYATGIYTYGGAPNDTVRVARFLSNGAVDPTFQDPYFAYFDRPNPLGIGPIISGIHRYPNGDLLVMGNFNRVNGEVRNGLCMVDSTGQLLPVFDGCGVGIYTYEGFTYGGISGYLETADNMAYIWGAYHGYNDGTTNDTLQRFVSRLYGPDFHTVVQEATEESPVKLYPNPTHGQVTITRGGAAAFTSVLLRDGTGRVVLEQGITSMTEVRMELGHLASGWYLVELMRDGERTGVEKLMLQP